MYLYLNIYWTETIRTIINFAHTLNLRVKDYAEQQDMSLEEAYREIIEAGLIANRIKRNANPVIVVELRSSRRNAKSPVSEQVWAVVDDLHRGEIDALVALTFKWRAYGGPRSTDTTTFRLVGLQNDATDEYHCNLKNLPNKTFSTAQEAASYRARLEIGCSSRSSNRPTDKTESVEQASYR